MAGCVRMRAKGIFLTMLAATCASLVSLSALAAPVEGCSQQVQDTQQAMAQARVAAAKAVDDEIFTQDDSVLALTCFNQSASIAAQQAGNIFSGDFRPQLASVVDDALTSMYGNFKTYTIGGGVTKQVNYDATKIDTTTPPNKPIKYDCNQPKRLWDAINTQGVKTEEVPYPTVADLTNPSPTAPVGSGVQYANTHENMTYTRSNLNTLLNGTAQKPGLAVPPQPSYKGLKKICDVLNVGGAMPNLITCQ